MSFLETNVGISKTTLSACFLADFILFPFTPSKDFTGRPVNEIHLYSTTLANAICAISSAKIGALMDNRLSEAIINAYKEKNQKPITFQEVFDHYTMLMPDNIKKKSLRFVLLIGTILPLREQNFAHSKAILCSRRGKNATS